MAKKKLMKTNALRLLDQKKIAYEEREFSIHEGIHQSAVDVAHQLGTPVEQIYKTLLAVGNKTGPIVAVIQSNDEVDMKKLAKISGNKKVEMLHLKDLEATTGYIRGGCSPIGMKKLFPTFIDNQAFEHEAIFVSAGKRGLQMKIDPRAIAKLTHATIEDIKKTE